ncbi:MAG: AAA family ATPase, partial [Clostridia bacterium]|nr:AAA family ATPase [Clostridia bacterium]
MLLSLHIEHMAVIRRVDVDFDAGLCVLTGETGAGKSLLIDSINCLLGGRTSRDLIRAGEDHATVSAVFSPPDEAMVAILRERGLEIPEGEELMLQRTIMRDGRARAFVNGRAVTQGMLRD